MKKGFVSILVLLLALAIFSCASAPPPAPPAPVSVTRSGNSPEWLNDFPPEDAIWGIGIAKQTSPAMSMTTAEARARVSVARQLDAKVQAMFTDYMMDAGNSAALSGTSMQEDVSRQVTNMNVSGARPIKRWEAPDGTWWFLVEFKKSDAKSQLSTIINNQEAQFAQFKAQQALQMLDAQLAKNENASGFVQEN